MKNTGSKYDLNMDVTEIATHLRKEIKAALAAGELPKGKYSVRVRRFSGGEAIDVAVTELPFACRVLTGEEEIAGRQEHLPCPWMTREAYFVHSKLDAMLNEYNRRESDAMTDYSNYHFYGHVSV